jgi:hypothetical protein
MPMLKPGEWIAIERQALAMMERDMSYAPTICVDFDGVLHSYKSGWKGAGEIPDPPVEGAMEFIVRAAMNPKVTVAIYSSRSKEEAGIRAMKDWLIKWVYEYLKAEGVEDISEGTNEVMSHLSFPTEKPAAIMTIDDRAHCFNGHFRSLEWYLGFKPWNKRKPEDNVPDYDMTGCTEVDERRADEALECLQDCLITKRDGFITFEGSAQEFLASFFRDVRQNAVVGVKDKRGVAELVLRALDACSGMCLDNEEERLKVRAAVMDALVTVLRPTEVPAFDVIAGWTEQERQEVREWAEMEHHTHVETTAALRTGTSWEMPQVLASAIEALKSAERG